MAVAAEIVAGLVAALDGCAVPRVRALHLPPPSAAGSKDGEFCALELDDGAVGLSYVLLDGTFAALRAADDAAGVAGVDALQLASEYASADARRRTIGFAAVNALSRHLFDRTGFRPADATDSIGGLDPQPGDNVGMVGLFPPLVKAIVARGARLTVLERRGELAGAHAGWHVTLDPRQLAGCRQVLCTSTVLLNDTLDDILAACRGAERLVLIGPGASCLPDALFARGVTALAGVWVDDAPALRDALVAGRPWGRYTRKVVLERAAWPGWRSAATP